MNAPLHQHNKRDTDKVEELTMQQKSNIERHIQTVLTSLVIILLGWVGTSLVDAKSTLVALSGEVVHLKEEMNDIKNSLKEERLDNRLELKEHEARLRDLENKMNLNNQLRSK